MTLLVAALLGGLAWTAAEYLLHRWVGHGPRRTPPDRLLERLTPRGFAGAFNDEHLRHHADARYFAPTSQKVAAAILVTPAMGALASAVAGLPAGLAFGCGFGLTYAVYELIHRRIHTHPPRGPYGRWVRRHHLLHHFKAPGLNHGVTTPLWDIVAGTLQRLPDGERLRVPRALAPVWMATSEGVLREPTGEYELAGTPRRRTAVTAREDTRPGTME